MITDSTHYKRSIYLNSSQCLAIARRYLQISKRKLACGFEIKDSKIGMKLGVLGVLGGKNV